MVARRGGVSRLLVVNDWLRRRFVRRRGQRVLQTWHGTPLKRLALHRPGFDRAPRDRRGAREPPVGRAARAQSPTPRVCCRRRTRFCGGRSGSRGIRAMTRSASSSWGLRRAAGSGSPRGSACCSTPPPGATTASALSTSWTPQRSRAPPTRRARPRTHAHAAARNRRPPAPASSTSPGSLTPRPCSPRPTRSSPTTRRSCSTSPSRQADVLPRARPRALPRRAARVLLRPARPRPRTRRALAGRPRERALAEVDPSIFAERYSRFRALFAPRDDGRAAERVVARLLDQGFVSRG